MGVTSISHSWIGGWHSGEFREKELVVRRRTFGEDWMCSLRNGSRRIPSK
jgi:hypothetical protein